MKERLATFLPQCNRVTEQLYLGGEKVAANKELLQANHITHVLNCAGTICLEYFPEDFTYKYLSLVDGKAEDVMCLLYDVLDWIDATLTANPKHKIFIHCQQGVSRSSTMLIAYLMWTQKKPFNDVLLQVKSVRDICNPNQNFQCQLMEYLWKRTTQPLTSTRAYRIQPHTVYSPELIVCKEISLAKQPLPLDPRGAFVFTTPTGCSIWIGKDCQSVLAEGATLWAHRFEKYEKVPPKLRIVHQESTTEDFWTSIGLTTPPHIENHAANDHAYQVVLPMTLSGKSLREEYRAVLREQLLSSGVDPTKNDTLSFDQVSSASATGSASSKPTASLYQGPGPEWPTLGTFDIDDLQSDEIYALVVDPSSSAPQKRVVYIWVGGDVSKISRKKARSLAKECLEVHSLPFQEIKVHLVKDGKEDDDFWKYFE